ncbi:MAG: hypothetical protein HY290_00900 [Planctomycetia bacterium]|nr:hypothetical protein [Planctomycetia bacterium]
MIALMALTLCNSSFADDGSNLDALIDALENHNPPPKIDDRGAEGAVLFDENYNWDEQDRVKDALSTLIAAEGNELWARLIEHMDDKRYSLTYEFDGHIVNATIGQFCREIAMRDIIFPYRRHLPYSMKGASPRHYREIFNPLNDLREGLEAWAWYRSRKGDSLRKLQIEVCSWALDKSPALHELPAHLHRVVPLSEDEKAEAAAKIRDDRQKLINGTEPIVSDRGLFHADGKTLFTPIRAERSKNKFLQKAEKLGEQK